MVYQKYLNNNRYVYQHSRLKNDIFIYESIMYIYIPNIHIITCIDVVFAMQEMSCKLNFMEHNFIIIVL